MIIKLNLKSISQNSHPYFIAEISGNHNGKIENAIKLIQAIHWSRRCKTSNLYT